VTLGSRFQAASIDPCAEAADVAALQQRFDRLVQRVTCSSQ
jgi:hypothetical protein